MITNGRKRAVGVTVGVCLSLTVAACGARDSSSGTAAGDIKTGPGFDGKTITIGSLIVGSGPLAVVGEPMLAGLTAYVDDLNDRGGIGGKYPVEIQVSDTAYDPAKAVQQARDTQAEVAMYSQVLGTAIMYAVAPQLAKNKAIALFTGADGGILRDPQVVSTVSPYETQVISGIEYLSSQPGGKDKVYCGAYLEGDIWESGESSSSFAYGELGLTHGTAVQLPYTATDYTPQVQQLKNAACDVVSYVGTPTSTGTLMSDSAKLGFTPQFMAANVTWIHSLKEAPVVPFMQEHNYLLTYDGALWGDTENAPGMADAMAVRDKYSTETTPDLAFVSGYNTGQITEQILTEALESGDLSREGIVAAQERISGFDTGGLSFPFTWGPPDDREPPSTVTIVGLDPDSETTLKTVEYGFESSVAAKYEFK